MTLPAPLVPANVDLRSMPEMPLEVALFKDASVIVSITDSAFKAAVLLWCASWHQIPASSLPDDDKILALIAGYGRDVASFSEIKSEALWKFIKCSDGRFYHPLIAEKAIRTWQYRENYRKRTAEARAAKAARSVTDDVTGSVTDNGTVRRHAPGTRSSRHAQKLSTSTGTLRGSKASIKSTSSNFSVTDIVTGLNQTKPNLIESTSSTRPKSYANEPLQIGRALALKLSNPRKEGGNV